MHRLPLEPFVARGLTLPEGADEIALAGLHAYYPMYARRKTGPQPLVEFAIGWLKRNVPKHRTRPSFAHFDAGQFLFVELGSASCREKCVSTCRTRWSPYHENKNKNQQSKSEM